MTTGTHPAHMLAAANAEVAGLRRVAADRRRTADVRTGWVQRVVALLELPVELDGPLGSGLRPAASRLHVA